MLSGTEHAKVILGHFGTPSMTFPHPIKKHLQKFSELELHPLRTEMAKKLAKMHYIMQLEEILGLYDSYDLQDEKNLLNEKEVAKVREMANHATPFYVLLPVVALVYFRGGNPLHFKSYVNNIYGVSYAALLSTAFIKWAFAREELIVRAKHIQDSYILSAKSEIHTELTALTNSLRFSKSELMF